jgi:uncharacterized membrane protein YfcA
MIAELTLIPIGLFIATISSMVGLGGGVFIVPVLVLAFGLPAQNAVGISLMTMTFTTISAAIAYARQGKINYRVGILLDVLDVPGAVLGAYLTTLLPSRWLAGLFGILLFIISIYMIRKREISGGARADPKFLGLSKRVIYLCLMASFASGVVAGMFGAGGGTVDETVMILALGMPAHMAAGTSVFGMALTNTAAAIPHGALGNILPEYAIPLIIGAVFGAQLGPRLSKRVKGPTLRKILGLVFIIIGLRMILIPYVSA